MPGVNSSTIDESGTGAEAAVAVNPPLLPWLTRIVLLGSCLIVLLFSFAFVAQAASAALGFSPKTDYPAGPYPGPVATADFNRDGNPDLAAASSRSNTFSVLLGDGTGGFGPNTDFSTFSFASSVISDDINKDGDPDLVLTTPGYNSWPLPGDGNVSVLLGDGSGDFAPMSDITYVIWEQLGDVTTADFNADGKLDLAVTNTVYPSPSLGTYGSVSVLLGDGTGGFGPKTDFLTGNESSGSVTTADFNADGNIDLAVTSTWAVSILLGDGSGGFGPSSDFPTGTRPVSVTTDDFNSDGKPDLVMASNFESNVSVLLGNGSGGFAPRSDFRTGRSPNSLTAADFNSDGKPDLAVANGGANSVSVLLGDGSGGFAKKADFATGPSPDSVVSDDFNGDKRPDLATANEGNDAVSVLLNKTRPPKANISRVKVTGPTRLKRRRKATYKVAITNSGDAVAKGVRLKVSGKGIGLNTPVGKIAAKKTRTVKVRVKPKKPGKGKAFFRVRSRNAGGEIVKKRINVKK